MFSTSGVKEHIIAMQHVLLLGIIKLCADWILEMVPNHTFLFHYIIYHYYVHEKHYCVLNNIS